MKRAVKEHPLGMNYVLKRQVDPFKKSSRERVYAVIKKVSKAGKFLGTTVQWVDLKMLCMALFQMLKS
jgi:hypothetical protein